MSENKYAYSFNGEEYEGPFDSYDEALQAAKDANLDEYHDDRYEVAYIGECVWYKPHVDADNVIEAVQDEAYDQAGDFAIDYLDDVTKEHRDKLESLLTGIFNIWAEDYGYKPSFFTVENVKEVRI